MDLTTLLSTVVGVGLLGVVAYDVYATILHSRAQAGPIAHHLNRRVWWLARGVAFRCARARRHVILNAVGPLLLPALVVTLIFCLMLGYALIYWPHMPASFSVNETARSPTWIEAFYFSGTTLTTLGYGDIAPRTAAMRLTALSEVSAGFAFISLAVTYLLTVTNALERKRTVALSFYHQAERGADAAGFLIHHFRRGEFQGLESVFAAAARDLQSLLESHIEHPVIHYFHPLEVHKSLPRMLFLVLEIRSVMKCCLDRDAYANIRNHPEAETLEETARYVLRQLSTFLRLRVGTADELPDETPEIEFRAHAGGRDRQPAALRQEPPGVGAPARGLRGARRLRLGGDHRRPRPAGSRGPAQRAGARRECLRRRTAAVCPRPPTRALQQGSPRKNGLTRILRPRRL